LRDAPAGRLLYQCKLWANLFQRGVAGGAVAAGPDVNGPSEPLDISAGRDADRESSAIGRNGDLFRRWPERDNDWQRPELWIASINPNVEPERGESFPRRL